MKQYDKLYQRIPENELSEASKGNECPLCPPLTDELPNQENNFVEGLEES